MALLVRRAITAARPVRLHARRVRAGARGPRRGRPPARLALDRPARRGRRRVREPRRPAGASTRRSCSRPHEPVDDLLHFCDSCLTPGHVPNGPTPAREQAFHGPAQFDALPSQVSDTRTRPPRARLGAAMTEPRFLVTGAYGCIGAWVVAELVADGAAGRHLRPLDRPAAAAAPARRGRGRDGPARRRRHHRPATRSSARSTSTRSRT